MSQDNVMPIGGSFSELLTQLQNTWHSTIPLSQFMQVIPLSFSGAELQVTAPLSPNINLHNTMFAGSIYTLMTLTGWGMVWLQQQRLTVQGDIVLADANIKYIKPITADPIAKVIWPNTDMSGLADGKRIKVTLEVGLYCNELLCAAFTGHYVSLPKVVAPE
ncbi:thioesterase domain-containing protein [Shewanella ulleungensis]|jgi:thioesterase domain-containing protein|uniref:Thioesterase n=1 Tax=Shewanella ulleungensis TaxID=2282699 RepID=A0ABQ2QS77_9GAMM|nr:thioesterase domain-containing protein [Shewanella ulleungensis]MCL1150803.1 thioesterase domain-containing protein [Shewanella ulleungensis]GGP93449.1 thioesterase [Shewanella ulleungensis]